jgi:hypothetical protein
VDWSVTPIVVEDRVEIKLVSTFETSVPAPILVADPPGEYLGIYPGGIYVGEFQVKNHGLIAVRDVQLTPSSPSGMTLEVLVESIPELLPQQAVTVPYRVTMGTHHSPESIKECEVFASHVYTIGFYFCNVGFQTTVTMSWYLNTLIECVPFSFLPGLPGPGPIIGVPLKIGGCFAGRVAKELCALATNCNRCCSITYWGTGDCLSGVFDSDNSSGGIYTPDEEKSVGSVYPGNSYQGPCGQDLTYGLEDILRGN